MKKRKYCKCCNKQFDAYDEYDDTCFDCGKDKSCQICLDCEEWFIADSFRILCDKCSERNHKEWEKDFGPKNKKTN